MLSRYNAHQNINSLDTFLAFSYTGIKPLFGAVFRRMAKGIHNINLLPNKGDTMLNQFLSWALTVGRFLVIVTETLALSVFIYRFSLDMKIVDLHDKIKNKSIIVENFKTGEDIYRNLQARLASAKQYDTNRDDTLKILKDVIELGRNKITFNSINVTPDSIQIQAQAQSSGILSLFTQNLRNYPKVKDISITRVENKTSSGIINIGLTAFLKENVKPAK